MPTLKPALRSLLAVAFGLGAPLAFAEPVEDLARCYVEKASEADQKLLGEWMFTSLAQHEGMAKFTKVTKEDLEKATGDAAAVMQRLVTKDCVELARTAAAERGIGAVSQALQVLGQVASRALLTDAKVGQSMNAVNTYMDEEKILSAVDPDGSIRAAAEQGAAGEGEGAAE